MASRHRVLDGVGGAHGGRQQQLRLALVQSLARLQAQLLQAVHRLETPDATDVDGRRVVFSVVDGGWWMLGICCLYGGYVRDGGWKNLA